MKVTGLGSFRAGLDNFAKVEMPQATLEMQRKIALQVLAGVVFRSPVDTGRFRASWVAQAGRINTAVAPEGAAEYAAPNAAKLLASSGLKQPFGVLYVSNSLPYAVRLEEGWSGQAPAGIIGPTIQTVNVKG